MQCVDCGDAIEYKQLITCTKCLSQHHYICAKIKPDQFRERANELKVSWVCSLCINITLRNPANNNENDSLYSHDETNMSVCYGSPEHGMDPPAPHGETVKYTRAPADPNLQNAKISYADFSKLLDLKLSEMAQNVEASITKNIRRELNLALDRIKSEFSQTTDFLSAEQKDLKSDIETANAKIKQLENEKSQLTQELRKVGSRLTTMENISRGCNIELQNVPEKPHENLLGIMKSLCEALRCPMNESNIHSIRRVTRIDQTTNRPRNILITLSSQRLRDNLITSFRTYNKTHKQKPLHSGLLNIPGEIEEINKIYVVEHLSPEIKKLYAEARLKLRPNYNYVWAKYGRVYARKSDDSAIIQIKNQDTLNSLVE
ncbi:hypothetical protein NE865_01847 [Phthorimaea operculella]|nr:hypothetical protein NE865_01847 [Phthorimaea operculella]